MFYRLSILSSSCTHSSGEYHEEYPLKWHQVTDGIHTQENDKKASKINVMQQPAEVNIHLSVYSDKRSWQQPYVL